MLNVRFTLEFLAKTATFAVLFAQLYTHDGQCHGIHSFLVPIRDPKTMVPFPGITIGDLGEKIGLNGVDNGYNFQYDECTRNVLHEINFFVTAGT